MMKMWTTEPDDCLEPRVAPSGPASKAPLTLVEFMRKTVAKHGDRPAMCLKRKQGGVLPTEWKTWTWSEYFRDCQRFAKTLISLDVQVHKCINIIGFNSPEWFIADVGAILAGAIPAGIYTSNLRDASLYISGHSKAEVIVVEDNHQLQKFIETKDKLPNLKCLVIWAEHPEAAIAQKCSVPVYFWDQFLEMGASVPDSALQERGDSLKPGHCSTLIYTSGTTGPPKAVMISHDNITWTISVFCDTFINAAHTDRIVSYLPLSHVAGQLVDIYYPMYVGACSYFAQPDALKGSLVNTLKDVRPTLFFGVPRVWEKMMEKMVQLGRETTGVKKMLSTWAKGCASEHCQRMQWGNGGGAPWGYGCANSIVLSKIKEALGFDQCTGFFTAAAPISVDTINYFSSLDIPLYELFGQSECTGPHTSSKAGAWKVGYCGRPMPGTETRIAENGELCYRGRHIFMGYMYMPEQTAETIDNEGFLHSGDVAEFDENNDPTIPPPSGFMKITGRIKELIITAGGENIPPVLIENEMKHEMPALSNCMVIGDKRKFLAMLISLKTTVDPESGLPTDTLAPDALFVCKQIGSSATTQTQAAQDPLWIKYINDGVKAANAKATSNAQKVQKWKMLPVDFSEKTGELTPTLKLKRREAVKIHADLIESLYAGSNDD